jgi:methionyl aminopeptidase
MSSSCIINKARWSSGTNSLFNTLGGSRHAEVVTSSKPAYEGAPFRHGGSLLAALGAKSAPRLTYNFPGWTCISLNQEAAHGIPSRQRLLQEGDLLNIDVSAELDGYWADNGGSFVLGADVHHHQPLVDASRQILRKALAHIKGGVRINEVGGSLNRKPKKGALT